MKSTTAYFVQLTEPLLETAMLAAKEAFPRDQLQLVPVRSVREAVQLPARGRQILVLGEASEADVGLAAQALDASELPRWAVVHVGRTPSDLVETLAPEACTIPLLGRTLRAAMLHHELLRENVQLRGDLKTLARRFNHDIRTPLGCINTVCALLDDPIAGAGRASDEAVTAIRDATTEIGLLLDRIGFVLRASGEPLPGATVAMGPLVQRVVDELEAEHGLRGARFTQAPRWPEVRGVEPWLGFVWKNLIQYAVQHGNRGRTVELGWDPRGVELRFWVAIDGAPLLPFQTNPVRPFHLLHQQPSASLELSLIDRLVSLQGGRCGCESAADKRTLYYFSLPAAPSGQPVSAPSPRPSSLAASRAG